MSRTELKDTTSERHPRIVETIKILEDKWTHAFFSKTVVHSHGVILNSVAINEKDENELNEHIHLIKTVLPSATEDIDREQLKSWYERLSSTLEAFTVLGVIQRAWSYFIPSMLESKLIRKEIPDEVAKFEEVDGRLRGILEQFSQGGYVTQVSSHLQTLRQIRDKLLELQKSLQEFFERKREAFPRFFFLSNDELIQILRFGDKPTKLFVNGSFFHKMTGEAEKLHIREGKAVGVLSNHGMESLRLKAPVPLVGGVEHYLQKVLDTISATLRECALDRVSNPPKDNHDYLYQIGGTPAQINLLVNRVLFTQRTEEALKTSSSDSLHQLRSQMQEELNFLIQTTKQRLKKSFRQKLNNLILQGNYHISILDRILADSNNIKESSFVWQSQLRCYLEKESQDFQFKLLHSSLKYNFAYLGNSSRLVITPTTEKITITAVQAMNQGVGICLEGEPGSGRTETIKDLASTLGNYTVVFNSSENADYRVFAGFFSGLVGTGCWGILQDLNKVHSEVLSTLGSLIATIQQARRSQLPKVQLQNHKVDLNPNFFLSLSWNSHHGRSSFPEHLKTLFRCYTLSAPDYPYIISYMLASEGFENSFALAKQISDLLQKLRTLIPRQKYLDWGIRFIRKIISSCGAFKISHPQLSNEQLFITTFGTIVSSLIVEDDLPLFEDLLKATFPNQDVRQISPVYVGELGIPENYQESVAGFFPLVHKQAREIAEETKERIGWDLQINQKSYHEFFTLFQQRLRLDREPLQARKERYQQALTNINTSLDNLQKAKEGGGKLPAESEKIQKVFEQEKEDLETGLGLFDQALGSCVAHSLITSAFIVYAGPLSINQRRRLLHDCILPYLEKVGLPPAKGSNPVNLMVNESLLSKWEDMDLPSTPRSLQNAALITNCDRIPLMIDPEGLGGHWIRRTLKEEGLIVLRDGYPNLVQTLETTLKNNIPVLVEGVKAEMSPELVEFLKNHTRDNIRSYNSQSRIILQTSTNHPSYTPDVHSLIRLVDFSLTQEEVVHRSLAQVAEATKAETVKTRKDLIAKQIQDKRELERLETDLLGILLNPEEDLLARKDLLEEMEKMRVTFGATVRREKEIAESRRELENTDEFKPLARRVGQLFSLFGLMRKIDLVYTVEFDPIVTKRILELRPQKDGEEVSDWVQALVAELTNRVISKTLNGLFKRHRLVFLAVFAFLIQTKDQDDPMLLYLLGVVEGQFEVPKYPEDSSLSKFITRDMFERVRRLETVPEFTGLAQSLISNPEDWKKWINSEKPETETPPGVFNELPPFGNVVLVKVLRPDRLEASIRIYIQSVLGEECLKEPELDLKKIFSELSPAKPLTFLLGEGIIDEPVEMVKSLRRQVFPDEKDDQGVFVLQLGQGVIHQAKHELDIAVKEGRWLLLENLHLVPSMHSMLRRQLHDVQGKAHQNFRLFLSTNHRVTQEMINILQTTYRVALDGPVTYQEKIRSAWNHVSQKRIEQSSRPKLAASLAFAVAKLHARITERRDYGYAGWIRNYDFSNSDLQAAYDVVFEHAQVHETANLSELKFVLGSIVYGGKITDTYDQRIFDHLLSSIFKEINPEKELSDYKAEIKDCAQKDGLEQWGLPSNSGLVREKIERKKWKERFLRMWSPNPRRTPLMERVEGILNDLQETFHISDLKKRIRLREEKEKKEDEVIQSMFYQEAIKANTILRIVKDDLIAIRDVLEGRTRPTLSIHVLAKSVWINQVPTQWVSFFPSKKNLFDWVDDLRKRLQQIHVWTQDLEVPQPVNLSKLFRPQAYANAILTQDATTQKVSVNSLRLRLKPWKEGEQTTPQERLVSGLLLRGAQWTGETLDREDEKNAYQRLPPMKLITERIPESPQNNEYICPVYFEEYNRNTFLFDVPLPSNQDDLWRWESYGTKLVLLEF